MAGSRHTHASDGGAANAGSRSANTALQEEVCFDRRYVNGGRELQKDEQQLQNRLEHVVEGEIIPRLMLVHKQARSQEQHHRGKAIPELSEHVGEFARLVVSQEADVAASYVNALLHKGADLEALLLNLLAPTARKLGELWDCDEIDFVDVTIGTSRLQQVLHKFTFELERGASAPGRRVLLLPTPGEQHTFGLLMVSEFFRREGWHVIGTPNLDLAQIEAAVAEHWFALIGFSLSSERLLDTLHSTIKAVRACSKNQSVQIVVGGNAFSLSPELRQSIGADFIVGDAHEAVKFAETALESVTGRPT